MSRPPILPGATIGILGGGQLGRMIALAARAMGYRIVTLDPTPDGPCGQVADRQIIAPLDDVEAAEAMAALVDVVTYEFENVDATVAARLGEIAHVPQGSALLSTTQHRVREKRALDAAGAPVAPWAPVLSEADLIEALARIGTPSVLKTATGGYDGKGQRVLSGEGGRDHALREWRALGGPGREMVLEAFVSFACEISVIVARSTTGETVAYPPAENVHVDNVLRRSIVPARIDPSLASEAVRLATEVATSLDAIGLLAVEMFVDDRGRLLVNELAPRPHNSGHWTMDACTTSQFEQHVRAVCGLPLGATRPLTPVVMANLLGEHLPAALAWLGAADPSAGPAGSVDVKVHLYGKREARRGRKMGHANVLAERVEDAIAWIDGVPIWR